MMLVDPDKLIARARNVLEIEIAAVQSLIPRLDERFRKACEILLGCQGRVVVTGMGKSGHIGNKIAATLASTGTPAFFVHPGEACHGDMGMIVKGDVLLALSNSGSTPEILTLMPYLQRLEIPVIGLIGNPHSPLAAQSLVCLDVSVEKEACPLDLAPTASTTAALALGDALAISLLEARGFTQEDFALSHPAGRLGKRLLLRAQDLMHQGEAIPRVLMGTLLTKALLEMTTKKLGMTAIVDEEGYLKGIFTDGDLRRSLEKKVDIHTTVIETVMSPDPILIQPETLAIDALNLMEEYKIMALVVTDQARYLQGILHMHDLLRAGVL